MWLETGSCTQVAPRREQVARYQLQVARVRHAYDIKQTMKPRLLGMDDLGVNVAAAQQAAAVSMSALSEASVVCFSFEWGRVCRPICKDSSCKLIDSKVTFKHVPCAAVPLHILANTKWLVIAARCLFGWGPVSHPVDPIAEREQKWPQPQTKWEIIYIRATPGLVP